MERFEAYAAARLSGGYTLCESPALYQTRREALAEHERLTREIASLRTRAGKESQLNRRVELNLQLKQLETRLAETANHL